MRMVVVVVRVVMEMEMDGGGGVVDMGHARLVSRSAPADRRKEAATGGLSQVRLAEIKARLAQRPPISVVARANPDRSPVGSYLIRLRSDQVELVQEVERLWAAMGDGAQQDRVRSAAVVDASADGGRSVEQRSGATGIRWQGGWLGRAKAYFGTKAGLIRPA